jgi:hypothetical protein
MLLLSVEMCINAQQILLYQVSEVALQNAYGLLKGPSIRPVC